MIIINTASFLMKSLIDSIHLRRFRFRFCMIFVPLSRDKVHIHDFPTAAVFRSVICQNTLEWNFLAIREGNDTISLHYPNSVHARS